MYKVIKIKPIWFQVKRVTGAINPYVGIHVRRTDKISEASFHQVEEYMKYVEEYFEFLEIKERKTLDAKRVYVASDDPTVLEECRKKYPGWNLINKTILKWYQIYSL